MNLRGEHTLQLTRRQLLSGSAAMAVAGFSSLRQPSMFAAGPQAGPDQPAGLTHAQRLAAFAVRARYEDISAAARGELKARVLDSLGCAIGALQGAPIVLLRAHVEEFGGKPLATLVGGGKTAPDRAALFNGALIRYLDFNDSFIAKGETCHPSDNIGALLAACEYAGRSGKDFLTALAVAYQVQCRLSEVAPVRAKGFDHVTQGAYAAAAAVAKALGLDQQKTAHAIAISGTANNALRVTRTGVLSHWKGLAYPNTAFAATHAAFLAKRGITGPLEVFEADKAGFMDVIAGRFDIDWEHEGFEAVRRTILKTYDAEIHSQPAIEGMLELRNARSLRAEDVEQIEVRVFEVAKQIIGGEEKYNVRTKEEADHSLQYIVAVALLDGQVTPAQYMPERILRPDVQGLLRKVVVRSDEGFSRRFPQEMPTRLEVKLRDGQTLTVEKRDYKGFFTRPLSWGEVVAKFEALAAGDAPAPLRKEIVDAVTNLEAIRVNDLTKLLAQVGKQSLGLSREATR